LGTGPALAKALRRKGIRENFVKTSKRETGGKAWEKKGEKLVKEGRL